MRKIFVVSTLFLTLAVTSCQGGFSAPGNAISPFFPFVEKAYPVKIHSVTVEERPWVLERPAKLESYEQAVIHADWDVRIKSIPIQMGQVIAAGATLALVEHERSALELEKKRTEIKETEAQIKIDKAGPLPVAGEIPSPNDKVALDEAKIDRLKAEIAGLESEQDKTEITAPIAGIITKKSVVEGVAVNKGDELFTIVRINPIVVAFELPLEQIAAASAIEEIKALFPPLEERSIPSTQISVAPERQAGGIRVTATLANDALKFKAGLEGTVRIITTRRLQILKVPDNAIQESGGKKILYRVTEDSAHAVEIETGDKAAGLTEVTRGLTLQDQIVVEGMKALRDGVAVQIQTP